jgi:hypothetical protein
MILELRDAGRSDAEILAGIEDLVMLRMAAGTDTPAADLTEDAP